ncbi:hypothetical protein KSS94_08905 [Pseudomonas fakonensis]|uniref:Uncharacterized protein n=1 Tax=Pseudomonas fakonensis TaxID=2842355 RepID=A0ABX8NE14_9PSED|nr:hypothetical protein [Pseudomonas fakonensis]QXH54292.1 hypothetical protein KSS94_08905 [Pseudomonas fakonensis]
MTGTLEGMILPGDPLMQEAVAAFRRYQEALAQGSSAEDVDRYRVLAESLFQAIADVNIRALGGAAHPLQ